MTFDLGGFFLRGEGAGRLFILSKRNAMAVGKEPDFGHLLNIQLRILHN